MEKFEVDYFGLKILVHGTYHPGEKGNRDVPPSPDDFEIEKVTVEENTDIKEFLDMQKIEETILEKYYER